ncbi:hypothetical protein [Nocardioides ferulae]|uniref:hypothetical protein n=1 Tax=Nocardioides ferulae TaxID=2340821 RepID=UPI000F87F8BC|nr:hypothetical protein [Nocardioides ferulae]
MLVLLVVVLMVALGAAAWLAVDGGDEPDRQQADREEVMDQARQFMLRVNTYGPDLLAEDGTMPDYRELVLEVITPKFRADFEENVTVAEQTVSQAGLGRTAEVYGVGVSALDEDSATVLVAGAFTNSYPAAGGSADEGTGDDAGDGADDSDGQRVEDQPAPFRVEVQLVLTGGEWLVDDFSPVTGEEEQ